MIALLVMAVLVQQATPQQFDLICEGTRRDAASGQETATSYRYRVDLEAGTWCADDCLSPITIQKVEAGRITFRDVRTVGGPFRENSLNFVDRVSGYHREAYVYTSPAVASWSREGQCAPTEFTGMPSGRF